MKVLYIKHRGRKNIRCCYKKKNSLTNIHPVPRRKSTKQERRTDLEITCNVADGGLLLLKK